MMLAALRWLRKLAAGPGPKQAEALLAGERRLLEMIARGSPQAAVLEAICKLFDELSPGLRSSVMLLDEKTGRLQTGAAPNLPQRYVEAVSRLVFIGPESGPCGLAASRGEAVIAADLATDPLWVNYRDLPLAHGLRACWSTPFASKSGKVLGTFALFSPQPASPTEQQLAIIERFTHIASIAVERTRTEEELRRSGQRYALVMEASEEGFWDWIVATDDFYASPRMLELYGFPPDTVFTGRDDFLARFPFHPEDRPKWQEAVAAHFAGKTARFDIEIRMLRGGETRWLHLTGLATRNDTGEVVRWTGATKDVTARKRAEEALRASEERYALAMEAAQDAHWDWIVGTGEYYLSPRTLQLYGLPADTTFASREDFLARSPLVPEDRDAWVRAVADLFAGTGARLSMELRANVHGETRWIQFSGVCVRDASGKPLRWSGTGRDVTDRKRMELALRESSERYALAVEAAAEGHSDWNLETGEFYVSPRLLEICGYTPGTTFKDRVEWVARFPFHPEDRPKWEQAVAVHWAGQASRFHMEVRIVVRGETRWVRFVFLCSRDASGKPVRWTGSTTDVTDRKCAEEALRISEERYARAMEGSDAGLWEWNPVTDAAFASPRAHRLFGIPDGVEIHSRDDLKAHAGFHSEDRQRIEDAIQACLERRTEGFEAEYRVINPAGETRWVRSRGKVFADAQGRPALISGSVTDIDARKLTEQELKRSEERYALVMAAADEGYWDWIVASDQFQASPRLLKMYGFPPDTTFAGRDDFLARIPLHPEDRPKWQKAVAAHFAGRTARLEMETRLLWGGETRWIHITGLATRDASGAIVRWTGATRDVTARKLAEEARRLSEERYARAMEGSDAGHWDWNIVTDEMFVSDRAREMLGLGAGALPASRAEIMEMVPMHSDDRRSMDERVRGSLVSGVHERDYRVITASGEVRWLHSRAKVFRDRLGAPARMTGSLTDITERKLVEKSLQQSEQRFRQLFENSADALFVHDSRGRFVDCNAAACQALGYAREELLELSVADITTRLLSEEERRVMTGETLWERAMQGEPGRIVGFEENELRRSDGTTFPVEVGVGAIDYEGRRLIYASVRETTERKRAEEELRSRQEMLELAQKTARAVAFDWRVDAGEHENRWPPELEAMYGLAPGTWPGSFRPFGLVRESWKKLVHPDDWTAVREAIKHAYRTGDVAFEYRVVHPDGSVHWLQSKGRMFSDTEGKPVRMVGLIQDVTQLRTAEDELKRMERQLRHAQRLEAVGTLAGGVAHDFNNILGAILGYGEMALRDAPPGSRLRRDVESILTAGERGRTLVERILAFSRSGVGERVAVHVEAVVREALELLSAHLPANVRVESELRAGRAAMLGDATQVHQVLTNLATNGIQAMSDSGGALRVSLEAVRLDAPHLASTGRVPAGDWIVLKIIDAGVGIAPGIMERIFDPFFTTKEVGVGTGLGLSLVHGIVAELGGAVDVASAVGAGSTFTVYLPRSGDAVEPAQIDVPAVPRGDRQRVLVVDDEEPLVRLATRTLEELGYEPVGFTSSVAALTAFRADPDGFDALVTDERMPGMSGATLIREVRGIRRAIPIVLVSGYLGKAVVSRAFNAGADEVLRKPLSARELATSLARVLPAL